MHYLIPKENCCFWSYFGWEKAFWSKNISVFRSQCHKTVIQEAKAILLSLIVFSVWLLKITFQWCNSFHACCETLRLVKVNTPLSLGRVDLENTASQTHLNNINEGDPWTAGRILQWQCFKHYLTENQMILLYSHWVLLSNSHFGDIVVGNVAISDVFCI